MRRIHELMTYGDRVNTENDRLREALKKITKLHYTQTIYDAVHIAGQALESKEG